MIAEIYDLLHRGAGISNAELSEIFAGWNTRELQWVRQPGGNFLIDRRHTTSPAHPIKKTTRKAMIPHTNGPLAACSMIENGDETSLVEGTAVSVGVCTATAVGDAAGTAWGSRGVSEAAGVASLLPSSAWAGADPYGTANSMWRASCPLESTSAASKSCGWPSAASVEVYVRRYSFLSSLDSSLTCGYRLFSVAAGRKCPPVASARRCK